MKIDKKSHNRMLIYFIYDRDGIVDDYIYYMLDDLKKNVKDICIVVNGKVNKEAHKRLSDYTDLLIERDNKGFDVWAYKTAIHAIGWKRLETYDEVILMNYTIMGPLYPLREMFETMAERDLDFWGITKFHQFDGDPFGTVSYGYLPEHIQSHFFAYRRDFVKSSGLHRYWDKMPMIHSYLDSVGTHEATFTKKFADMGYKWDVYVDSDDYKDLSYQPVIGMARQMIEEKHCPIFKRRSFMQDYSVELNESAGQEGYLLLDYLENHTHYPMNMFWDNILRLENQADIKKNIQANYILPANRMIADDDISKKRIALVMHMYFPELIDECYHYASSMPQNADVYITTNTEEKKRQILEVFSTLKCNHLEVTVTPNRGRDVGPFLVEFQDKIGQYDYICHTHDKKVGQLKPGTVGASFAFRCNENTLSSNEYVQNIIHTFETHPRLGILMPPPPNHAQYYITLGLEWGPNFEVTKKLADELDLHIDMRSNKEPIAPLGSVFWARGKALKKLFDHGWSYEDMPEEPVADDGTILHAVERIYSYVVQDAGYYPGWVLTERGAANEITNLNHMLRTLNTDLFFPGQAAGMQQEVIHRMDKKFGLLDRRGANTNMSHVSLYLKTVERDFCEEQRITTNIDWNDGIYEFVFDVHGFSRITAIRVDPCEAAWITLRDIIITISNDNGANKKIYMNHVQHNGIYVNGHIIYLRPDPQVFIFFNEAISPKSITVKLEIAFSVSTRDAETIQKKVNKV